MFLCKKGRHSGLGRGLQLALGRGLQQGGRRRARLIRQRRLSIRRQRAEGQRWQGQKGKRGGVTRQAVPWQPGACPAPAADEEAAAQTGRYPG